MEKNKSKERGTKGKEGFFETNSSSSTLFVKSGAVALTFEVGLLDHNLRNI